MSRSGEFGCDNYITVDSNRSQQIAVAWGELIHNGKEFTLLVLAELNVKVEPIP